MEMNSYTIYFIIFACIAYLIVTDASIAKLVVFLSKLARFEYEKVKWWIFNSPQNPIVRYQMHRRSMKLAEELMKEYNSKEQ